MLWYILDLCQAFIKDVSVLKMCIVKLDIFADLSICCQLDMSRLICKQMLFGISCGELQECCTGQCVSCVIFVYLKLILLVLVHIYVDLKIL